MRVDQLVLLIIGREGDDGFEGRTRMQKVVYFLSEVLGVNARFSPYFYGPYSEIVARSLDSLVARGLVQEVAKAFAAPGPFEGKAYTYSLTDEGGEAVDALKEEQPDECEAALEALDHLLVDNPSTRALAVASKLHVIVQRSSDPVPIATLQRKAQSLGWRIGGIHLKDGVRFLVKRELVETVKT
jgi:uncharacterized protein YwgA